MGTTTRRRAHGPRPNGSGTCSGGAGLGEASLRLRLAVRSRCWLLLTICFFSPRLFVFRGVTSRPMHTHLASAVARRRLSFLAFGFGIWCSLFWLNFLHSPSSDSAHRLKILQTMVNYHLERAVPTTPPQTRNLSRTIATTTRPTPPHTHAHADVLAREFSFSHALGRNLPRFCPHGHLQAALGPGRSSARRGPRAGAWQLVIPSGC